MTFFIFEKWFKCTYLQKVISKKQKKNLFLMPSWRPLTKIAVSGSGSVSQRYGSADLKPYKNVTDPQQWYKVKHLLLNCMQTILLWFIPRIQQTCQKQLPTFKKFNDMFTLVKTGGSSSSSQPPGAVITRLSWQLAPAPDRSQILRRHSLNAVFAEEQRYKKCRFQTVFRKGSVLFLGRGNRMH